MSEMEQTPPEPPKVYIVCLDQFSEGICDEPQTFKVFPTREAAETFKRRADECGFGYGQRVVIAAEWIE